MPNSVIPKKPQGNAINSTKTKFNKALKYYSFFYPRKFVASSSSLQLHSNPSINTRNSSNYFTTNPNNDLSLPQFQKGTTKSLIKKSDSVTSIIKPHPPKPNRHVSFMVNRGMIYPSNVTIPTSTRSILNNHGLKPHKTKVIEYAVKSVKGKSLSKDKINQDDEFTVMNFAKMDNSYLLGVLDGHGVNGHLVSNNVKRHYLINIEQCVIKSLAKKSSFKEKNIDSIVSSLIKQNVFFESFKMTNEDLEKCFFDISSSGTTLNTVFLLGNHLICSNVGDSRAILGKLKNSIWTAQPISKDHKPEVNEEYARIKKMNGRVEAYQDESWEIGRASCRERVLWPV